MSRQYLQQRLALYLDLVRWNRPAGWLLLLWPSLGALWLAAGGFPGAPGKAGNSPIELMWSTKYADSAKHVVGTPGCSE